MSRNWAPRAGFTEDLLEATVGLMLATVGLMLATVGLILAAVGLDSGDPRRPRPESAAPRFHAHCEMDTRHDIYRMGKSS